MPFNLQGYIAAARAKGIPDSQTYAYLQANPQLYKTSPKTTDQPSALFEPAAAQSFTSDVNTDLTNRSKTVASAIEKPAQDVQSGAGVENTIGDVARAGITAAGETVGGVFDIFGDALKAFTPGPVKDLITNQLQKIQSTNTPLSEASKSAIQSGIMAWQSLSQSHPDIASSIAESMNIGMGLIGGSDAGEAVAQKGSENIADMGKTIPTIGSTEEEKAALAIKNAREAITPDIQKMPKGEYMDAVKSGKIVPATTGSTAQYVLSDSEKATAAKYSDLLQSGDPVRNTTNIMKKISDLDKQVGKFLTDNPGPIFNDSQLKSYISSKIADVTDVMAPDASRLDAMKSKMVSNFVDSVDDNTQKGLWQARKAYDWSADNVSKAFDGAPTLKKGIIKGIRNAAQDFIAENTADGVYKGYMKDMSGLFDLADTTAEKAAQTKGLSRLAAWGKAHPAWTKLFKYGASAVGGAVGASVLDHFTGF